MASEMVGAAVIAGDEDAIDRRLKEEATAMIRLAVIDATGTYRYSLTRRWGAGRPVVFVMLNPSTADAEVDDATVRRCIGYARARAYGALEVVNLFALRATDPLKLELVTFDPVGPENDAYILDATRRAALVVVAWGVHGSLRDRDRAVMDLFGGRRVWCLGVTKDGFPRHPVRLSLGAKLVEYRGSR